MGEKKGFIVAIDGPAASGKGTIASELAQDINGFYLYSGAFYRTVALYCIRAEIDLNNESLVELIFDNFDFRIENNKFYLNNMDVAERIKKPDTAEGASVVGVYSKVRENASITFRQISESAIEQGQIVVAEGRDMGSAVFPDAAFKVFLTARPEVRAKRRMEQYVKENRDLSKELEELKKRDLRDSRRDLSPLPSNPEELGYFVLDNSDMDVAETLDTIKKVLEAKKLI
jgi:CMP/dCMP kinase